MSFESKQTTGEDIDSRCLKCKSVTNHTIIAMTGNTIAKVECNCCHGRHNYRPPVAEIKTSPAILRRRDGVLTERSTKTATTTKSKTAGKRVLRDSINFDKLLSKKDASEIIPYSLDAILITGNLLIHPIFGLGAVTAVIAPNKAQVTFQEHGSKLLVCKLG